MKFLIKQCSLRDVDALCAKYHGYGGAGRVSVYAFGVYEDGRMVAGYAWQPPPVGAATAVCPEFPQGVLALSRMVAVPREERALKHVSKPLMEQMKRLIDRARWPVLVTYSDSGQGHTGYVYQCSGWEEDGARKVPFFTNDAGVRTSSYACGKTSTVGLTRGGYTEIKRWVHRVCPRGQAHKHAAKAGWRRVAVPGKVWASGRQAYKIVNLNEVRA